MGEHHHSVLTRPQRLTLAFLEHHPRTRSDSLNLRRRIGMLRVMQERGLVSCNLHGQWSITRAGQTLLIEFYSTTDGGDAAGRIGMY